MMKTEVKRKAFTLAEVLITLAIIGVVAAMTIPSVVVNSNQREFKTGLRKAVSVLNSAITMNKTSTGESPYENADLYSYLQQHMNVMKSKVYAYQYTSDGAYFSNKAFYTTDGMRFEFLSDGDAIGRHYYTFTLHETGESAKYSTKAGSDGTEMSNFSGMYGNCGSKGLKHNHEGTNQPPCIVIVDVNGDRKPYPQKLERSDETQDSNGWITYKFRSVGKVYPDPKDRLLKDLFPIMITDQGAIPYGVVAQKAMYQAQK